jgi:hypothetical protein
MNDLAGVDAATTAGWSDLVEELDRWGEAGRVAVLWWRDDDAVEATPQLDDLLRLAGEVPIAIAVIPALARPDLADALASTRRVAVLQHGWQHANRAGHGKKSEFPEGRPAAVVGTEIGAGRARLKAMFGARALPVLVPPWNRFACELLQMLPGNGITGLSTMAVHGAAALPPGVAAIDVHIDLVAWRRDRRFIGVAAALGGLVGQLRARRLGAGAAIQPLGVLTHHLIMDPATVAFLDQLTALTGAHAAARWAAVGELLQ